MKPEYSSATQLVSKVLVFGSQILPRLVQDLMESSKATPPVLWRLLCLAYAVRREALLTPLARLLLHLPDQPGDGIPDDFREAAVGGGDQTALIRALEAHGRRQRDRDPLAGGEPESLRFLVARAEDGLLLFIVR